VANAHVAPGRRTPQLVMQRAAHIPPRSVPVHVDGRAVARPTPPPSAGRQRPLPTPAGVEELGRKPVITHQRRPAESAFDCRHVRTGSIQADTVVARTVVGVSGSTTVGRGISRAWHRQNPGQRHHGKQYRRQLFSNHASFFLALKPNRNTCAQPQVSILYTNTFANAN
jgi:hypothetical protein